MITFDNLLFLDHPHIKGAIMKKYLFIMLLLFTQCDYRPIYSQNNQNQQGSYAPQQQAAPAAQPQSAPAPQQNNQYQPQGGGFAPQQNSAPQQQGGFAPKPQNAPQGGASNPMEPTIDFDDDIPF